MTKPTVFVQPPWENPSIRLFRDHDYPITDQMHLADIVVFNGGEDIHPKVYGESIIPSAGINWLSEARDKLELKAYEKAQGKFKFGICRGGQLMNIMNGGRLWQDVNNHELAHDIVDISTKRRIFSSSVHHQMFIPGPDVEVVASCEVATTKTGHIKVKDINGNEVDKKYVWWRDGGLMEHNEDVEVAWYAKNRDLCIQGHPEYAGYSEFTAYCFELIERYI